MAFGKMDSVGYEYVNGENVVTVMKGLEIED
jgi:hypothetical protein